MKSLPIFAIILSFAATAAVAQQKPNSVQEFRKIKMFAHSPTGDIVEVLKEEGFTNLERSETASAEPLHPTYSTIRLPGTSAKIRFKEGEKIDVLVQLPPKFPPSQVELFRFEKIGNQRIAALQEFHTHNTDPHLSTIPYKAGLRKDGQWVFITPVLTPGEYCFSPRGGNDNYCFGIDPK